MNANQLRFGIEIETLITKSMRLSEKLRLGLHHGGGHQVPYLPTGWKAERDRSITTRGGFCSCEIISPILRGADGLAEVVEVLRILNTKGHRITRPSCGVHVHVSWKGSLPADALLRLVSTVAHCERGLYAITGTKYRERSGYCDGVRKYGDVEYAQNVISHDRNHALNLVKLARRERRAVEFRVFSGSINPIQICGWIQVCLGLVERAINDEHLPVWKPKPLEGEWETSGAGKGKGASEAERLINFLAWGVDYGSVYDDRQFGWVSDIIPQEQIKAEFRRLAAKYDSQP